MNTEYDAPNTKLALILAAGALFAEHGFEGVRTRMIAEKAGVNLGGIHYHFGSKEKLYVEAFRYVCKVRDSSHIRETVDACMQPGLDPEAIALKIRDMVAIEFEELALPHKAEWKMKLIVQEMSNPSSASKILMEELFLPDMDALARLFSHFRPAASREEADVWAYMMAAQHVFYMLTRPMHEKTLVRILDKNFFDTMARSTARIMVAELGLPVPSALMSLTEGNTGSAEVSFPPVSERKTEKNKTGN